MLKNKQLSINFFANVVYMVMNYLITFFLGSYIVQSIGGEAYGFINLCNTIVNYATLITVALNSVAGRFITIEVHRKNIEKANRYFSSAFIANVILSILLCFVFVPITINLEHFFEIPIYLVGSVKILFILTFINLIITIIGNVFTVATFITNKLYLSSIANLIGIFCKVFLLWLLFGNLSPSLMFVGMATLINTVIVYLLNIAYTQKLMDNLKIRISQFSLKYILELFMSGIWNSITRLSQILSDGLDVLFSNIWIGSYAMGQLSIAYTIPNFVSSFFSMVISLFSPQLTESYAKEKKEELISDLKLNMKMTGFVGNIIFFEIVLIGKDFFQLWVPNANIDLVYTLSVISVISILASAIVSPLSNVFLVTNKLKVNSLVWLAVSFFNTVCLLILLSTTNLGVFAVAGVSKIVGTIVNLTYLPIYSSMCINAKKSCFYPLILRYFISTLIIGGIMILTNFVIGNRITWFYFFTKGFILFAVGFISNYYFFLDSNARNYFKNILRKKFKHI